jgi:hypothetical protein
MLTRRSEVDPDYGEGDMSTSEDERFRHKIEEQDSDTDAAAGRPNAPAA